MSRNNIRLFKRKTINKLVGVLLMTALGVTALTGCRRESEPMQDNDLIVVGFSQVGSESSWRVANSESIKSALSEENGFRLIFQDAKQKQEDQYKAVRTFIQQKVDYIILAPITETGWEDVLREAKEAGIPVIIVDRQVAVEESLYTAWVGTDFLEEGRTATRWLEHELAAQGREEDEISILHIQGTIGATSQLLRTKGLEMAVEKHENWNIVDRLEGEYTEAKAYEIVSQYLKERNSKEQPPFDVIYSENDNMTFGVLRALDEAGISYGRGGKVLVISFDAVKSALQNCLEGRINLCVECNPLHGPRVAKIIQELEATGRAQKRDVMEEVYFDTNTLTAEMIAGRSY